jgi:hypothetical protein
MRRTSGDERTPSLDELAAAGFSSSSSSSGSALSFVFLGAFLGSSALASSFFSDLALAPALGDLGDHLVDLHHGAFLGQDLFQRSRHRRGHFGVDLVGRDLQQGLVALHVVADLLQPAGNRTFDNAFAHLGHQDFAHLVSPCPAVRIAWPNTVPKCPMSRARISSRGGASPSSLSSEVTGRVSPHGMM